MYCEWFAGLRNYIQCCFLTMINEYVLNKTRQCQSGCVTSCGLVLGLLASHLIGLVWYSKKLFQDVWMRNHSFTELETHLINSNRIHHQWLTKPHSSCACATFGCVSFESSRFKFGEANFVHWKLFFGWNHHTTFFFWCMQVVLHYKWQSRE